VFEDLDSGIHAIMHALIFAHNLVTLSKNGAQANDK
jgi:hypothetical protein